MSGRLVILPHKSWNVWNQDNRENVLRDERIHREAEEAKAENEKRLLQEQNLELLRGADVSEGAEPSVNTNDPVAPFRLFEDLEKKHFDQIGNAEYLKEKAAKELAQKKREGLADWALGEGSYECSKSKPWYSKLGSATQSEAVSTGPIIKNTTTTAVQREHMRKSTADPMGTILVLNAHDYVPKHKDPEPNFPACAPVEATESKEDDRSDDSSRSSEHKHKKRKRDKEHKERKEHKEKSSKHDRDHSRHHKHAKHDKHDSKDDLAVTNREQPAQKDDPWAALRLKRLEREAVERKRAALLLAQKDIYGAGQGSGSTEYSQQYHPHLARHHRN